MSTGRVDCFSKRAERNAAALQLLNDPDQVRQRPAEPIEFLYDKDIAAAQLGQTGFQAGTIVAST